MQPQFISFTAGKNKRASLGAALRVQRFVLPPLPAATRSCLGTPLVHLKPAPSTPNSSGCGTTERRSRRLLDVHAIQIKAKKGSHSPKRGLIYLVSQADLAARPELCSALARLGAVPAGAAVWTDPVPLTSAPLRKHFTWEKEA